MSARIRKGDTVEVTTGRDRGKRGRVLRVHPDRDRVTIERVNVVKKHQKPNAATRQGGIIEKEAAIHVSNVMIVSPADDKRTRIGSKLLPDGRKARIGRRSGEVLDK